MKKLDNIVVYMITSTYVCCRWGIVGVSSQMIMGQVTAEHYQDEIENITLHTGRLCPNVTDEDTGSIHSASTLHHHAAYTTATRITGDKEYPLHTMQLLKAYLVRQSWDLNLTSTVDFVMVG